MTGIFIKALMKGGSKVSPTIKSVTPKVNQSKIAKAIDDVKLTALQAKGRMKKQSQDFDGAIRKVQTKLGQSMQKLKGEKVTESGVSKGKDLKKVEKKATGGRVGRRFGSPNPKKSNIQKIKETFGPKKKVPSKFKGFSKLPEKVQQKIDAKLAKKV